MTDIYTAMGLLHPDQEHTADTASRCSVCRAMAAPTRCEARTGYAAGDYGEVPVWCLREIALGSFKDAQGVTRYACQAPGHKIQVKRMYGVWVEPEQADPITAAKALELIEDDGTAYFEDDEEWTNREGMPEFNGAFR